MPSPERQLPKGRGSGGQLPNRFLRRQPAVTEPDAIDDWQIGESRTIFLEEDAKQLVNEVKSPDVGMLFSMNPYQGCEHGCVYCYARNTHEYWGYSAGLDFEQKIIVKKNAPQLLESFLNDQKWKAQPISLSGNTDCYQPAEQKFRITRRLLEICLHYRQPVSIITKNAFVLKDADVLNQLAAHGLVSVLLTITSFQENLRRLMEPRTTTANQRLRVIDELSALGIPTGVMLGPVIPGLNDHEMPSILNQASAAGATFAAYTFIRLNGSVKLNFQEWLFRNFPDRAEKVWHLIEQAHGGKVSDSRFGIRMRGEGPLADVIRQQFGKYCKRFGLNKQPIELNCADFWTPGRQLNLFG